MRQLLILLLLLTGHILNAQNHQLSTAISKQTKELEKLYQTLHSNPELSFQEKNTSALLVAELTEAGFTVSENIGGYGVVGVLKNGSGPVVMVRTDMDALPVKENTGIDFSSNVTAIDYKGNKVPVMHACGHDLHMSIWTGVAKILSSIKSKWKGTVVFIAQPAEEVGAGAKAMLADGLYTRFPTPDYVLALHVNADLPAGVIGYTEGAALANIDMIDIRVKGKGGHGGMPSYTIDPIVLAAKMILAMQSIVSREINPIDPAVITVGSIHGGTKGNIIPSEVNLELTIRSLDDSVHQQLIRSIRRVARGEAIASGVSEENLPEIVIRDENVPAVYNDPALTQRVVKSFVKLLGDQRVQPIKPVMFGEDFARYGRTEHKIPIFMYSLGTVPTPEAGGNKTISFPSTHSPTYLPAFTPSLKTGMETMLTAVLELLK